MSRIIQATDLAYYLVMLVTQKWHT